MRPTGRVWWRLHEASVAMLMVIAGLSSPSHAAQSLQQDTSEPQTLNRQEGSGRSGKETTTTPAGGGALYATLMPWEGFTRLSEALGILTALDQPAPQSNLHENALGGEDKKNKKRNKKKENEKSKRHGRMMKEETAETRNLVEGEEKKEGRFFLTGLTGNSDQQVTISVNSMWSAVAWIVLWALLIKWLVQIVSGKGLGYWGRWMAKTYGAADDYYYHYPDQSSYSAFRALDELTEKYN